MSSITNKLMMAAAGAGGAGLDITDVFSTYLYEGTGSARTITNGIDLAEEDGLVWLKKRSGIDSHYLMNVIGSTPYFLSSNNADSESSLPSSLFSLTNSGFNLNVFNDSGADYASWTFRSAPRFFQKIRYSGNGASRSISHNLGCDVGAIFVKNVSDGGNWSIWHRGLSNTTQGFLHLNETASEGGPDAEYWDSTAPTSTEFYVGNSPVTNGLGKDYIAFIFAHNDGDGGFGPDGDQDIIKCGSYTSGNTDHSPEIDLGFEPQWVMIKSTTNADPWVIIDTMRGFVVNYGTNEQDTPVLQANTSNAESATYRAAYLTNTGFFAGQGTDTNEAGQTYIYMAIRRGPLAQPESGTEVFAIEQSDGSGSSTSPEFVAGFPVDAALLKATTISNGSMRSRLTGTGFLETNSTSTEGSNSFTKWDFQNGWYSDPISTNYYSWMWKRAPGFFDVVAYTGDGTAGRTISHNLGVTPEMMWVKKRSGVESWAVYHSLNGGTHFARLQGTDAYVANSDVWDNTDTTASVFTVDTDTEINQSGQTYIAYLFASLDGVSKVFSVTKSSGSDASVDCGFTSGPRFVMLKRTDSTGDWYVWDTERGIVAGNDPYLLLNSTAAEVTSTDYIDPTSNGFTIVNGGLADGDYIGYAVS